MLDFKIDEQKCIECGLCAKECPVRIIQMNGKPEIVEGKEKNCLKCQHCLAVCPTGALSIFGKNPDDSVSTKAEMAGYEQLSNLVKTRRSIRKYKDENIEKAVISNLLETAAHAPTGHNKNSVLFSVIDNKETMLKFRDTVYASLKKHVEEETLPKRFKMMEAFQKVWFKNGIDIIFRDAPHMLVASAPNTVSTPETDSVIALTYFELLANAQGIGTLWNGMIQWVIDEISPELRAEIGIPEEHKIGSILIFGKSATKYARGIQSEGLHLNNIEL